MTIHYAVDFGTTNPVIASDRDGAVTVVSMGDLAVERIHTPVAPSAVYFREQGGKPFAGQLAVQQNVLGRLPGFAQGFKRRLGREPSDGGPGAAKGDLGPVGRQGFLRQSARRTAAAVLPPPVPGTRLVG